ncbi:hypothetical protein EYF80_028029 [Liparis tanakae]|uniref:Uncharacterized protein n=1 Tax=Liparis tanakae TaxID=230148 RepID=A0A4Z2H886_9TELE|nr:hypothetical protein EYF80_028029 [Liparis tanakae]
MNERQRLRDEEPMRRHHPHCFRPIRTVPVVYFNGRTPLLRIPSPALRPLGVTTSSPLPTQLQHGAVLTQLHHAAAATSVPVAAIDRPVAAIDRSVAAIDRSVAAIDRSVAAIDVLSTPGLDDISPFPSTVYGMVFSEAIFGNVSQFLYL